MALSSPSRIAWTLIVILGFFLLKIFFDWWTYSRPEYGTVLSFVKTNPQISQEFGAIQSVSPDEMGTQVDWNSDGLSFKTGKYVGKSEFTVVGSKLSGKVEIRWTSSSSHEVRFLKVVSVPDGGSAKVLLDSE